MRAYNVHLLNFTHSVVGIISIPYIASLMDIFLQKGIQSFVDGNYDSAIDNFTLALNRAKTKGGSRRDVFDLVERRAAAYEKIQKYRNSHLSIIMILFGTVRSKC